MRNVNVEIKSGKMYVTVDLNAKAEVSGSGKTLTIASTGGLVVVGSDKDGKPIRLNLSVSGFNANADADVARLQALKAAAK